MTTRNLSKIFITVTLLALVAAFFVSCTDDEQAKMQAQQKRIEELEQKEQENKIQLAHQELPPPTQEAQPQQPEEPEQVVLFKVFKPWLTTKCQCLERHECGISVWGCEGDGMVYECLTNVAYTIMKEAKTNSNSSEGSCGMRNEQR